MNLSAIDVNLVVALDALLRERNVTRAAKRMGLSQPAMSHTLTRLREALDDPILVRVGRQMVLTERAEALAARVSALMQELEGLFGVRPAPFEPRGSTRTFRLLLSDEAQLLLLPPLLRLLSKEAPRVSLDAAPLGDASVIDALRSGARDLAIGPYAAAELPADLRREVLYRDRLVGLARVNHPKARGRVEMDAYLAAGHLVLRSPGERDAVDELLARKGLSRRAAAVAPHVLVVPHLVAESDLVATLPGRVASAFETLLAVRSFEPPFDIEAPEAVMVWHDRAHADPASRWLRSALTEASLRRGVGGRRPPGRAAVPIGPEPRRG